ncbi:MAG TPA: SDR family oxidoreductase [Gemmataceae bacterium]|nr:SDR family oxidoreductase [Gemmataceae bacterium]
MRVLVTGATGLLGGYLLREAKARGLDTVAWGQATGYLDYHSCDLAEPRMVSAAFRAAEPDLVIHAGALASVEACRRDPVRARRVNTDGTALLAEKATMAGARMVHVSTDLVFDGEKGNYRETDVTGPLSLYGRTKVDADHVLQAHPQHAVARSSLLFGPTLTRRSGFFDTQLAALRAGKPLTLFEDEWRTPLSLAMAAQALLTIALSKFAGLIHVGGPERMSRLEMGQRLAAHLGADPHCIVAVSRASVQAAEPRPRDSSLDSSLWRSLFPQAPWPEFEAALREMGV